MKIYKYKYKVLFKRCKLIFNVSRMSFHFSSFMGSIAYKFSIQVVQRWTFCFALQNTTKYYVLLKIRGGNGNLWCPLQINYVICNTTFACTTRSLLVYHVLIIPFIHITQYIHGQVFVEIPQQMFPLTILKMKDTIHHTPYTIQYKHTGVSIESVLDNKVTF